ncbi:MAG: HEAT repeat domain-containing protein [Ktedonobacteraceae bacterium]
MPSEEAISLLLSRLNEQDEYQNAIQELSDLGSTAVPSLIHALTNSSERVSVRIGSARALGKIRDERAIAPLISACNLTADDGTPLYYLIVHQLAQFGVEALPQLVTALSDRTQDVFIRAAAWTLGRLEEPSVLELLIERLKDINESSEVRSNAASGLGGLGNKRAVAPLMEVWSQETDEHLRWSIAMALGELGDERAIAPLIEAVAQDGAGVRAVEALEQFGASAFHALLDALQNTDYRRYARRELLIALGHFKQEEVFTTLLTVLKDENEESVVRSGAVRGLIFQGDYRANKPLLAILESHKDISLRINCAAALCWLGDQQMLPVLQKLLQNAENATTPNEKNLKKSIEMAIGAIKQRTSP